jgi:hypothetical protein
MEPKTEWKLPWKLGGAHGRSEIGDEQNEECDEDDYDTADG